MVIRSVPGKGLGPISKFLLADDWLTDYRAYWLGSRLALRQLSATAWIVKRHLFSTKFKLQINTSIPVPPL